MTLESQKSSREKLEGSLRAAMADAETKMAQRLENRIRIDAARALNEAWSEEVAALARASVRRMLQDSALFARVRERLALALTEDALGDALVAVFTPGQHDFKRYHFSRLVDDAIAEIVREELASASEHEMKVRITAVL